MESSGKIVSISRSYPERKTLVTVELDSITPESVEGLVGKVLTVVLKIFRKKRTLTQNGYYWKLIGKISDKTGISGARLHNEMLCMHPHPEIDDITMSCWEVWMEDTDENHAKALEAKTYHLYPTSDVDFSGKRKYVLLRGSSTFNTEEMSALLNSLIERAKEAGVETMTPDEVAHLRAMEEGNAGNANNKIQRAREASR